MAQNCVNLTCGTRFFIEDAIGSGTFIEVEDVTTFGGEIGQTGTFLESTTITDCSKTYVAGLSDAPDWTVTFTYCPTTNQTTFINSAVAGETRQAKIEFADKTGSSPVATATFELAMAGFTMSDPAPDTLMMGNVSGKASKFVWA